MTGTEQTLVFSAALKHPTPANSIAFQSVGMTNGTIEENKVIEEGPESGNMETSKEEEEEEEDEEEFTESDDDEDDVEEEDDDDDTREVN